MIVTLLVAESTSCISRYSAFIEKNNKIATFNPSNRSEPLVVIYLNIFLNLPLRQVNKIIVCEWESIFFPETIGLCIRTTSWTCDNTGSFKYGITLGVLLKIVYSFLWELSSAIPSDLAENLELTTIFRLFLEHYKLVCIVLLPRAFLPQKITVQNRNLSVSNEHKHYIEQMWTYEWNVCDKRSEIELYNKIRCKHFLMWRRCLILCHHE